MIGDNLSRLYVKLVIVLALAVAAGLLIWQKPIPLGLDLRGGSEILYRIRTETLIEAEKRNIVENTINVIRKRVDPEGKMELDIRPRGKDRFYIQLPGLGPEASQRIEELIRRAGKLRFCLVDDDANDRATARRGELVSNHTPFLPVRRPGEQRPSRWHRATYAQVAALPPEVQDWYLVENTQRASGQDLVNPHSTQDELGMPAVGFSFKGKGRVDFERTTEENRGRQLAIILDEDLYSAPQIKSRISRDGVITGNFTQAEVDDLVSTLRAGQLPADIELEWNNTVGPQLGEDSIRGGIRASLVGLIFVVGFMAVYYLVAGAVADFAVMLNLLFVLGAMAGIQSVLTLPGIAGLVLTLGMAVDANVLINERIREESAKGKTLRLAVSSGHNRAFVVILDSNLTTIIAGLILFGVGTGPVRGFAITLCLGLAISMFTSIWVTRWVIDAMIEHGWLTQLRMLQFFKRTNIRFSRIRYICIGASVACGALGLTVFGLRGKEKYDTDLTGGFRAEIELKQGLPIGVVRERIAKVFPNSDVQSVWSTAEAGAHAGAPKRFSIRVRELTGAQKAAKMRDDFLALLKGHGLYQSLEQPDPKNPWQFKLRLSSAVSERALRQMLAERRYTDSEIRAMILQDTPSTEYVVQARASALSDRAPDAQIAQIINALEPLLASQSVRVKAGDLTREQAPLAPADGERGREIARPYVTLKLGEACSTLAVREAIIREILGGRRPDRSEDLRVAGHGADSGAELARDMAVYGSEPDLQKIAHAKMSELRVFSVSMPTSGDLHLQLNSAQLETSVRERLDDAKILDKLVGSVIPEGVTGRQFAVFMYPLSEEKSVEKIKQELLAVFQKELTPAAGEKQPPVAATGGRPPLPASGGEMTPTEPPAYASDLDRTQGAKFFKVKLARRMQLQEVQAALLSAGYGYALAVNGDINNAATARTETSEPIIKLTGTEEQIAAAKESIAKAFKEKETDPFRSIESIGPLVAAEMKNKAFLAILLSWVAIIFYLWFRFGEVKFGLGAVIALVHDVLFTLGAVAIADALSGTAIGNLLGFSDIKINVTMIAAFLTLIGYSANDTIVVFDRIRENMGGVRRKVDAALVDVSVNQTLSRTLLTSLTVFLVVAVLYVMGGAVIHGFAFVMLVGVFVGTYSSVFIASPVLIDWDAYVAGLRKAWRIVTFRFDQPKRLPGR